MQQPGDQRRVSLCPNPSSALRGWTTIAEVTMQGLKLITSSWRPWDWRDNEKSLAFAVVMESFAHLKAAQEKAVHTFSFIWRGILKDTDPHGSVLALATIYVGSHQTERWYVSTRWSLVNNITLAKYNILFKDGHLKWSRDGVGIVGSKATCSASAMYALDKQHSHWSNSHNWLLHLYFT